MNRRDCHDPCFCERHKMIRRWGWALEEMSLPLALILVLGVSWLASR